MLAIQQSSALDLRKGKRKGKGEHLNGFFSPTVDRYEVATGRPNGHTVQKYSLRDMKSDRRERVERHTANSGGGKSGEARSIQGLEDGQCRTSYQESRVSIVNQKWTVAFDDLVASELGWRFPSTR
jgi:hypothetical protein